MKSRILALAIVAALALPLVAIADESAAPAKPAAAPTTEHHSSSHKSTTKVNLNSAEKDAIAKLPGLTDELADKIIAARPYKSGSELVSKKILTQAEYNKIKSHVTTKASTTPTASAEKKD
jgi:DNA uptake protein ComE-like DNA-binding protein